RLNGVEDFVAADGAGADVVERAVVRLRDDRVDRAHLFVAGQREHVVEERVGDTRHVQRRRQENRRLDLAELLDLRRSHDLAEAVADEDAGRHFLDKEIPAVREDGGDAGADGLAADDGGVPDADAGDVGDGVERPRRHRAEDHAGLAGARARRLRRRNGGGGGECAGGSEHAPHRRMPSRNPKRGKKPSKSTPTQSMPGTERSMRPKPDHGEESYRGCGKLQNLAAVITGGDSGIGRAVAIAFAREGADVAIGYLSPREERAARETLAWIERAGRRGLAVRFNVQ